MQSGQTPRPPRATKPRRKRRIALAALAVLVGIPVLFTGISTYHTQWMIGLVQSALGSVADSTMQPRDPQLDGIQPGGQYRVSNIQYATEFPNSYFDIVYPDADRTKKRPTLVYVHGGGYFFGTKQSGDPLSGATSNAIFQALTDKGWNIVTMDYALVPGHRCPTPLRQLDQFLAYLTAHADQYGLQMDTIDFFGQSAGAIMISQYFTAATNPDFAELAGVHPTFDVSRVGALAIDDGPLIYPDMNLYTKFMVGNYVAGTIYLSEEQEKAYNPIPFINGRFPRSFVIGSDSYGNDLVALTNQLTAHGVANKLVWPKKDDGTSTVHTFITHMDKLPVARRTFDQMVAYLRP